MDQSAERMKTIARVATLLLFTLPLTRAAEFVEPAGNRLRFRNGDATLVLDRAPWHLQLLGLGDVVHFDEASAPAFQLGGEWIALAKITATETTARQAAHLKAELANGQPATVDISAAGPDGFRVIIRVARASGTSAAPIAGVGSDAVTAVRGATRLAMVEEVYGFGEMWNGHVAQRGQSFDLWDHGGTPDECAYMPYYVSTRNYAFFLNYGGRVHIDAGQRRADVLTYEGPARELDVTLVAGTSIASTVQNFLTIVGLPQRPPRWSFKPWFWLMGDPNRPGARIETLKDHHFIEMVNKLHAMDIPIGVTWFEPPWQTARTTFVPNPQFSHDLPGLVRELSDLGVRALAWTVPYTTNTASNWKEAMNRGFLARKPNAKASSGTVTITASGELGGSYYNSVDFYNPEAVSWWQQQIERSLSTGIRGFKLDAGQDLEPDARLYGDRLGADVHNAYALEYNRAFFEVLKQNLGDDFLMIPRAAWVGSSAYTNFKWPGDLAGTFGSNGLPSSVYSSLSLAFCGLPFVSTDIGGFDDQPAEERPWLRWAQFGAMLPGMQTLHMPWWYSERAQKHFRYLTWLHTDLTPTWMSLAHEAAATGAPVCRPLVWSFQDDLDTWRVDDEFTVGDSLLVAPFLNSNFERMVYLPAGVWHDFWNDAETVVGPKHFNWQKGWSAVDKFPLYIREGAILPLEVSNEHSGFGWAESSGYVTLAIWPKRSGRSEFVLHDTEGPVSIFAAQNERTVQIGWGATKRNHLLRVHLEKAPKAVASSGAELSQFTSLKAFRGGGEGWFFEQRTKKLWVRKNNQGAAGEIRVELGGS